MVMLQFEMLLDGPEIVSQVQLAGRLNATQDAFFSTFRFRHDSAPVGLFTGTIDSLRYVCFATEQRDDMDAVADWSNPDAPHAAPRSSGKAGEKVRDLLIDGLKAALARPGEHRLFSAGRLHGLFPSKHGDSGEAAKQALAAGLLEHVRTESKGKFLFEFVRSTSRTAEYVADHDSPKAILRELRQVLGETKAGVPMWMDQARNELRAMSNQFEARAAAMLQRLNMLAERVEDALRRAETVAVNRCGESVVPWAEVVLVYLDRRSESGQPECPLSELFHVLSERDRGLTLTAFQDGIRRLFEVGAIRLTEGIDDPEFAVVVEGRLCRIATRRPVR
jgi:hypothetical protein